VGVRGTSERRGERVVTGGDWCVAISSPLRVESGDTPMWLSSERREGGGWRGVCSRHQESPPHPSSLSDPLRVRSGGSRAPHTKTRARTNLEQRHGERRRAQQREHITARAGRADERRRERAG
jgi:hypothetical protein